MERKKKLGKLRRFAGRRIASTVFISGMMPAIDFGAEVLGFSDTELAKVQSVAAAATCAGQSGRSLTANRLIYGDPTWRAMVAPLAVWRAVDKPVEDDQPKELHIGDFLEGLLTEG